MLQLCKPLPVMLCHQRRFPAGPPKREVHSILIQCVSGLHRFTSIINNGCGLRRSSAATVALGWSVQRHDCHDAVAWMAASKPPDSENEIGVAAVGAKLSMSARPTFTGANAI